MRWIERFDLFLLDLDGLLVNTEELHFAAYRELCTRQGFDLDWDLLEYLGIAHTSSNGLRNHIYAALPKLKEKKPDWSELYREKRKIYLDLLQQQELALMPGAEAFIKELASSRVKRCVATHSPKEQVEAIKMALPVLKTIPLWITREDYECAKPEPDAYLKAISLLADPGDRIIGFEDSMRGIRALQGTSAMPVLICDEKHPQLKGAALEGVSHFASFKNIPSNFKNIVL